MAELLTKADNFWLSMDEPTNLMVITAFMEFEEPLDYKRLFATINCRLASFSRFQEKAVTPLSNLGIAYWEKDKNYDLRSHIKKIALPSPGGKAELQSMVSDLMASPLDRNRPLWDIHLIENYGKGCVLFFRIHHCIADGIALIHVLLSCADTDPQAPWPKIKNGIRTKPLNLKSFIPVGSISKTAKNAIDTTKKIGIKALKEIEKGFSNPEYMKKILKASTTISTDFASVLSKHTIMSSDPKTAFKGKLGTRKKVAWTDPINLDKIKKVGRAINTATLNDVLIATVTGAMRRYLKTRNTPVNELDLRVAVPVNIRKPGAECELGNKFSLIFLSLPVYLEDPVLRLKEVKRRMDQLKKSPDPYINFGLLSAIGLLPPPLAKRAAHIFGNKASGVLTNVPGPRESLYFAGKKIGNMMFWVPRSGIVGLGISILSYDGKVTVGIASDEGLMPDPEVLLEGFEDEFNHLLDLVQTGKIYDKPLVLHDRYKESQHTDIKSNINDFRTKDVEDKICTASTKSGKPCKNPAVAGTGYCSIHGHLAQEETDIKDVAQIMSQLI